MIIKLNLFAVVETWFHQILYVRNLYPRSIFEKEKKFRVPVYIATHPGVQEYISNFVQTCYSLIAKAKLLNNPKKRTYFDVFNL